MAEYRSKSPEGKMCCIRPHVKFTQAGEGLFACCKRCDEKRPGERRSSGRPWAGPHACNCAVAGMPCSLCQRRRRWARATHARRQSPIRTACAISDQFYLSSSDKQRSKFLLQRALFSRNLFAFRREFRHENTCGDFIDSLVDDGGFCPRIHRRSSDYGSASQAQTSQSQDTAGSPDNPQMPGECVSPK